MPDTWAGSGRTVRVVGETAHSSDYSATYVVEVQYALFRRVFLSMLPD
jgi:hypothetical protein